MSVKLAFPGCCTVGLQGLLLLSENLSTGPRLLGPTGFLLVMDPGDTPLSQIDISIVGLSTDMGMPRLLTLAH